jgi:hypothetical protein
VHATEFRWTDRNEDKPWRCPQCSTLAMNAWVRARYGRSWGPRTVFRCCGLRWRVGMRAKSLRMDVKSELKQRMRKIESI